jgi:demethylmenaquinone methyltransferase/2-methoxy-6-polyprenyl-1,4-benzoquinol methylase
MVPAKNRRAISGMFDAVAHRYDLLNRLLSLGIDGSWRRALARELAGVESPLLDVCTGTGDVALAICRSRPGLRCLAVDFAKRMVQRGRRKVRRSRHAERIAFGVGDAMALPVRSGSAGAVTVAFGIRNVEDPKGALGEMYRVLRRGGRIAILEFSLPRSPVLRAPYLFYFRRVLPRLGGGISGVAGAYRYLPSSVLEFPEGAEFRRLMTESGFTGVREVRLSGGIATLYLGEKLARA